MQQAARTLTSCFGLPNVRSYKVFITVISATNTSALVILVAADRWLASPVCMAGNRSEAVDGAMIVLFCSSAFQAEVYNNLGATWVQKQDRDRT